jgi:nicotinate phosphoribosyltransferase
MTYSHLKTAYGKHLGLLTDLYQLTMAYGYWKQGLYNRRATFHLFYRKPPFDGQYVIASGLALATDLLQNFFSYSVSDIQYLGSLKGADGKSLFDESFINYLQRLQFSCDVWAVPEGTVVLPHQPILRIEGPLLQCQLVETALLSIINFSSLIATKSARIVEAAAGDSVLEFGMRRAQGLDGAITASRAAYIGGCHATSNVMAGKLYGIPVKGTHAHSWVMCFDDELSSFEAYAASMPNNCIFLVDTFDTIEGVKNAIQVGKKLKEGGHKILGIRLDSGDLVQLSQEARKLLDKAGFQEAAIVASDSLDEYRIKAIKEQGAKISVWGVGTRLATSHGQSALGGVYKLGAIQDEDGNWQDRLKKSEIPIKTSNPGRLQTYRLTDSKGIPQADMMFDVDHPKLSEQLWDYTSQDLLPVNTLKTEELLVPVFEGGLLVYSFPNMEEVRSYAQQQKAIFRPISHTYPNGLSLPLYERKMQLLQNT